MNSTDFCALLHDPAQAGVYQLPVSATEEIIAGAEANGFFVFRVDLRAARNKDDLLACIGEAMIFPEWYGYNYDALADCLADLGWRPAEGYLVLLEHCDAIRVKDESALVTTLQVFRGAANAWREQGIAFWCLADMPAGGNAWLPPLP